MATKKPVANPVGRPSSYRDEYAEQAYKYCLLGAKNDKLAELFEVSGSTIDKWIAEIPKFSGKVKAGRELADAEVAKSLFHRAVGYSHPDVDIKVVQNEIVQTPLVKHYPPDTSAATLWLKNRQGAMWRDKIEQELSGNLSVSLFDSGQAKRMAELLLNATK